MLEPSVQDGRFELVREGNTFRMYYTDINTNQRTLYDTRTLTMQDPVYVGLAVTSHEDGMLSLGVFSNVELIVSARVGNWALY